MITILRSFIMCGTLVLAVPSGALAQSCALGPVTVQILGSGGPAINRERASSSYLLWIDGQAKMLVDIGGGSYLRFGQSDRANERALRCHGTQSFQFAHANN